MSAGNSKYEKKIITNTCAFSNFYYAKVFLFFFLLPSINNCSLFNQIMYIDYYDNTYVH